MIKIIIMDESIENFEDFYNEFSEETLIQELQKSEDDIKTGRTISFSEFKEKLRMMYGI